MYVRSDIESKIIIWFCWKHVVFFALYSGLVYFAYHQLNWKFIAIPFLPVGTIGTAVAFYVGFKNNSSYERLWEGRKIWGAITNLSRSLGALLLCDTQAGTGKLNSVGQVMVRRQIAWCNALRLQLRATTADRNSHRVPPEVELVKALYGSDYPSETLDSYLAQTLPVSDLVRVKGTQNPALRLLELQLAEIASLPRNSESTESIREKLLDTVLDCIKEQGSAERLKQFPFPRQYAHFSGAFVWIFLLLLPFGLVDELAKGTAALDWLVIPFSTVISWMFITMEQVGDSSEDPFEMGLNDVPMTAICRNIEIELLQLAGVDTIPEAIQAKQGVLL